MEKDLLGYVVPYVEKEFRVLKDKNHRAIFGYSMGGGHSTTIGFGHDELFAYVAGFSGYAGAQSSGTTKLLADPEKTNRDYKLIFFGSAPRTPRSTAAHAVCSPKRASHSGVKIPAWSHYQIWRIICTLFCKDVPGPTTPCPTTLFNHEQIPAPPYWPVCVAKPNASAHDRTSDFPASVNQHGGLSGIEEQDKTGVDDRFKVFATVDFPRQERMKGNWYPAVPPLCRPSSGLCPADSFGRTMVSNLPPNIKIGVVNVSVAGCKIELFEQASYQSYASNAAPWMKNIVKPTTAILISMWTTQVAQKDGVTRASCTRANPTKRQAMALQGERHLRRLAERFEPQG
jgi:hypothetical protein